MTKAELIEKMAQDAGVTKAAAGKALASFIDSVESALAKGDKITLVGFGTWKVTERKARTGRNPQTGKEIKIAASKTPGFKAGATLKEKINNQK